MTTLITAEEQEAIELVLQALDAIRNGKTPTKKSLAALSNHTMACTVFLASYSDRILHNQALNSNKALRKAALVSQAVETWVVGSGCEANA